MSRNYSKPINKKIEIIVNDILEAVDELKPLMLRGMTGIEKDEQRARVSSAKLSKILKEYRQKTMEEKKIKNG